MPMGMSAIVFDIPWSMPFLMNAIVSDANYQLSQVRQLVVFRRARMLIWYAGFARQINDFLQIP